MPHPQPIAVPMAALTRIPPITPERSKPPAWRPVLDLYDPSLVVAAAACATLVADMERGTEPYWLTLVGVNGCGKTMLARQVHEQAHRINPGNPQNNPIWPPNWSADKQEVYRERRPNCVWIDERAFASRVRSGEYDLPDSLRADWCVAFDELGTVRDPTNFIADQISSLAERRLRRWMIWTTNLNAQEIGERIDARVSSRLIRDRNRVVKITAGDYALRRR